MPYVSRPRQSAADVAVVRDIQAVPYRWTSAYRRARDEAAKQKAAMKHRVSSLWPSESGQSTSGMLRTGGRQ